MRIFSLVILGYILISTIGVSYAAPSTPPPNGYTGGIFSVYFKNMVEGNSTSLNSTTNGLCPIGQGIIGYRTTLGVTYGTPICGQVSSPQYWTSNNGGGTIYFTGAGNVGIGTSTPSAKLDVSGNIRATTINNISIGRGTTDIWSNISIGGGLNQSTNGNNTAIGREALRSNTNGTFNTAVGDTSLYWNTTGNSNTSQGYLALHNNTIGNDNTAVGASALSQNTTGNRNVGIGKSSLFYNTTGNNNTAVGQQALAQNTTGNENTAIGWATLSQISTGYSNTAVGGGALFWNSTGFNNTALGASAGSTITTGSNNITIGNNTQPQSSTGSNQLNIGNWIYGQNGNIGIGTGTSLTARLSINGQVRITGGSPGAGKVLTSDAAGLASWQNASSQWTTAGSNIYYTGANVGIGTTTPSYKLHVNGVGYFGDPSASYNPTTYSQTYNNTIQLGSFPISYTLYNSYDGGYWGNLFIGGAGMWSGRRNTLNGSFNQSVGGTALGQMGTGTSNNVFGWGSFRAMTTGSSNTAMGRDTGYNLTTGNSNSFFGAFAGRDLITGSNNIAIGASAQLPSSTASNQLNIGNWIYGNNGNIGIGTSSPGYKLDVLGSGFRVQNPSSSANVVISGNGGYIPAGLSFTDTSYTSASDVSNWAIWKGNTWIKGLGFMRYSPVNACAAGGICNMSLTLWDNGDTTLGENTAIFTRQNGNVGIGTNTPSAKLEVVGDAKMGDIYGGVYGGTRAIWKFDNTNPSYGIFYTESTPDRLSFAPNGGGTSTPSMSINGDNVGIGTTAPSRRLSVEGSMSLRSGDPTVYLRDTDHNAGMIHMNSNLMYFLRGCGNDTESWCTNRNGWWPLYLDMTNSNAYFGADVYAFNYYYNSDKNLKKDIVKIDSALDKINRLNGYYFTWKKDNTASIGVIAQEIEKEFPQIVSKNTDASGETYKTVLYGNLVAPLIEATKELSAQNQSQQKEIEELRKEIEELKSIISHR